MRSPRTSLATLGVSRDHRQVADSPDRSWPFNVMRWAVMGAIAVAVLAPPALSGAATGNAVPGTAGIDAWIVSGRKGPIGAGVHSADGDGQTLTKRVARGRTVTFTI